MADIKIRKPAVINGYITVRVSSDVMSPMLRRGRDIAIFKKSGGYSDGDVVLIRTYDGRFLIRRVVCVSELTLIARADREVRGERFRRSQVLGVLDCFFRDGVNRHDASDPSVKLYASLARVAAPIRKLTGK